MKKSNKDNILAICTLNVALMAASKIGNFDVIGFLILVNAGIVLICLMNDKNTWK